MSVNEPLYNFARAFADRGSNTVTVKVNGNVIGTLSIASLRSSDNLCEHYKGRFKGPLLGKHKI